MEYIGRTLAIKSERTGRVESIAVLIARCFPSSFDFQVFLIELYLKDFGVYQTYTMFLDMYLTANQDNLPDDEILEQNNPLNNQCHVFCQRQRTNGDGQLSSPRNARVHKITFHKAEITKPQHMGLFFWLLLISFLFFV